MSLPSLFLLFSLSLLLAPASSSTFAAVSEGRCLANATTVDTSKPTIALLMMSWTSTQIDNTIAFILINEVLGYPVVMRNDEYYNTDFLVGPGVWQMLINETISITLEIWQEYYPEELKIYLNQVYTSPLGMIGQTGWWYFVPDSLLEENPLMDRLMWKDFQRPAIAQLFQGGITPSNSSYGILLNAIPSWATYDYQIINNLNLSLEVYLVGSEDALFDYVLTLYNLGIPFLFYAYHPNAIFSLGLKFQRLYLPDYTEECYSKLDIGGIDCDYPSDLVLKATSITLREKAPGPQKLVEQMTFANVKIESLLGLVAYQNYSVFDAACSWIKDNNNTWSEWIGAALLAEEGMKNDGGGGDLSSGAMAAIIVVVVIVSLVLLVVAFSARRFTRRAAATVKKMEEDQKATFSIPSSALVFGRLIGRGNFGEVYVGEYRGTQVAIKRLMNQKMSKLAIAQFSSEVAAMVNLRHPNIVLFMGACSEPSNLSIVVEYMRFGNLYDFLHGDTMRVGYKLAHQFAISITKGMQYIHAAGILHRDLKTPNILLDKKLNVKISDFGLSCLAQSENALDHVSLLWTAPEILTGNRFTEKSDVYSMGIILWELLAQGAPPYPGLNVNAIARAVLNKVRPAIFPEWDQNFVKLITVCWAHDPVQRPTFAMISHALDDMDYDDLDDDSISTMQDSSDNGSTANTTDRLTSTANATNVNVIIPPPIVTTHTTFVMTHVQGVSALWQWNPSIMATALAIVNKEISQIAVKYRGYKSIGNGDSTILAFSNPFNALSFCIRLQQDLLLPDWPKELSEIPDAIEEWNIDNLGSPSQVLFRGLRVGLGVHCGTASTTTDSMQTTYYGAVIDKTVQVGVTARGGQIVITQAVVDAMSQQKATGRISIVVEGGPTENMFTKLEPHFCEVLHVGSSKLGTLYQLVPSPLRDRMFGGPTNTELLESYDVPTNPGEDPSLPLVGLPKPNEKWVIQTEALANKQRTGINPTGDVEKGMMDFVTPVTIQNVLAVKLPERILLNIRAESASLVAFRNSCICIFYGICLSPLSLVWEFCENGDLARVLANPGIPLPFARRVQFLKDIARGMAYLTDRKVFFELRPVNILVDKMWNAKLGDFGFRDIKNSNQTVTQSQVVAWTAPEVIAGNPEDIKALVYSFGMIMWQLLSRKTPWEGTHSMKIMDAVERGERPTLQPSYEIEGMSGPAFTKYVKILRTSWSGNPNERPLVEEIIQQLDDLSKY